MNMTTVPSNQLKAMQHEIADLKEQLAQLRIEADFNFDQYQDAGRLLCDLQEIAEQQAEAIRLKDVAIIFAIEHEDALDRDNRWYTLTKALSIQPSPETLQARDKRVAEACAKALNPGEWPNECDRNIGYKDVECIRSGEWRKYL